MVLCLLMMKSNDPLKIAVFDLNQTVYHKSSKDEFFRFVAYKKPHKLLNVYHLGLYSLIKELNLINKTEFKENFFHYLDGLEPALVERYAAEYWSIEWSNHFHPALLERIAQLREAGIQVYFITGALDVYAKPLFEHYLQVDGWIGTRSQYIKGRYRIIGKACKEEEKIRRLQQVVSPREFEITEAYSDKKEAILQVARQAFLVKDQKIQAITPR